MSVAELPTDGQTDKIGKIESFFLKKMHENDILRFQEFRISTSTVY